MPINPIDINPIDIDPIEINPTVADPYHIDMEVAESAQSFDMDVADDSEEINMDLSEQINVTVVQGTDVSDTTAVESDVAQGKKFYKADGSAAFGTYVAPVPVPYNDVVFWDDYAGEIAYSYSASEFANLTEMPANPSHDGMISEGWNWSLADAKAQVALAGFLDVGQMYVTADGKTRLYIVLENGRLSPTLTISPNGTVVVDWGDGSSDTITGTSISTVKTKQHTYSKAGEYTIALDVTGTCRIGASSAYQCLIGAYDSSVDLRNNVYRAAVKRIELGTNLQFNRNCFYMFLDMQSITIPSYVTAFDNSAFYTCRSLRHITFPSGITTMGTSIFRDNSALQSVSIPKTFPTSSEMFRFNYAIRRINVPNVSSIANRCWQDNYCVSKITIPSTVTSIGTEAFSGCYGVKEYHLKPTTPPTLSNTNTFTGIPSDCVIYVPSASLATYQAESYWSTYASYMVGE